MAYDKKAWQRWYQRNKNKKKEQVRLSKLKAKLEIKKKLERLEYLESLQNTKLCSRCGLRKEDYASTVTGILCSECIQEIKEANE